ncbi:MAG TPA: M28 family peptidase [Solirubrobacterales bacterium]|jgi:Peptidase family M28|nr:M28 family peptidase [Solirubrobacterales bacterium]
MRTRTESKPASHLDPSWHRQLLDELCAIHRPSASPGERQAAEWLLAQLSKLGIEGRIDSEPAHGTYWWPLGIAAALGAVGGFAALREHRLLGAACAGLGTAAAIDDLPPHGRRRLRRLLPQGERSQVLAEFGPGDAERTVVVMSHHDAPHSGLLYSPVIPETLLGRLPRERIPDTSPPLMWAAIGGQLAVALGAASSSRTLTRLGMVWAAGTAAVFADIGRRDAVPAANDNGTGVVGLLALARSLGADPPRNLRVLFLSTSEEATCDGIAAFAERHFPRLPLESTFFLCLETVGSPHLAVLRGEGMLRMRDYPRRSLALLDGLADELGIELEPNLRNRSATDAVQPLFAGYECAAIVSVTDLHQLANYHWPTDVPENVDYSTLADAIRLAEAAVRRLDERWL